jgi:hypothetical protein
MADISFGLGQTYTWSDDFWATKTNIRSVNESDFGIGDGWLCLSKISPTTAEPWDNIGSWVENNDPNGDNVISGGVLTQTAPSGAAFIYNTNWANGGVSNGTWSMEAYTRFIVLGYSSNYSLRWIYFEDGVRTHALYFKDTSGSLDYAGTDKSFGASGISVDTRAHLIEVRNNNIANSDNLYIDGSLVASNIVTTAAGGGGYIDNGTVYKAGGPANLETRYADLNYYDTFTPFQTSDGIYESDPNDSLADAGIGVVWNKVTYVAITDNSTLCTIVARTSDTAGGLAGASYFSITSGVEFSSSNKKRYLQIKITFSDASSGQYTPILKSLICSTYTPEQVATFGGVSLLSVLNGDIQIREIEQIGDWTDPTVNPKAGRFVLVTNTTQAATRLYIYSELLGVWNYV